MLLGGDFAWVDAELDLFLIEEVVVDPEIV
jgi:hypothetical protein